MGTAAFDLETLLKTLKDKKKGVQVLVEVFVLANSVGSKPKINRKPLRSSPMSWV